MPSRHCRDCGTELPARAGRGRPRLRCGRAACPKPRKPGGWTELQLARLRELYPTTPVRDIYHLFGRSQAAVQGKVGALGLKKAISRKRWTRAEKRRLKKLYLNTPMPELVRIFGCPKWVVYRQAHQLGLRRSEEFTRELARKNAQRPDHPMHAHRFPKGHVPANKGKKMPGFGPGRMKATQFKKGQRPQTWLPIGTEVVDSYGYRKRKVRDGMKPAVYNFEFVHKLLWIKHRGKIPRGHVVIFKDGDKTNIRMKNLACISQADNMRQNSLHNLPPELKQVIYLKGALRHRITTLRRREREEQDRGSEKPPVRDARGAQGQGEPHARRAGRGHRGRRAGDRQQREGRGGHGQGDGRHPHVGVPAQHRGAARQVEAQDHR